jgi:hypothetical protein
MNKLLGIFLLHALFLAIHALPIDIPELDDVVSDISNQADAVTSSKNFFSARLPAMDSSAIALASTCKDKKWGYQQLHFSHDVTNGDAGLFEQQDDGTIVIKKAGLLAVTASLRGTGGDQYQLIIGSSAFGDGGLPPIDSGSNSDSHSKGACGASLDGFSAGSTGSEQGEVVATRWIEAHAGYKLVAATVPFPGAYWQIQHGQIEITWRPLHNSHCHASQVTLTHWGACYRLNKTEPFLVEGARKIEAMGITTLKTTLSVSAGPKPDSDEEKATVWKDLLETKYTITDVAKHSVFQTIFGMNFSTYVLVAYTRAVTWDSNYYRSYGMSEKNKKAEAKEMEDLTEYLMTEYNGTGKTFVLQNWEGDNVLEGGYSRLVTGNTKMKTKEEVQKGMVEWLTARQNGVESARSRLSSDVTVLHAAEACKVWDSFEGKADWMATQVLPHVKVDLVSYSAYDSQRKFQFPQVLDFLNRSFTPSDYVKTTPYSAYPTFIGEYGMAEVLFGKDSSKIQPLMRMVIETCLERKCPFAIYWQLYGNELITNNDHTNSCDAWDGSNDGMKGYWVYRPDGTKWDLMYNLLEDYNKNC